MKKKVALMLVLVMAFVSIGQSVGAINVIMNSSFVHFPDQEPVIDNGVTLVPIRPIAEALGLEILWDDPTDTVTLKKNNFFVEMVIGSTSAKTSRGTRTLEVAPKIINSRTMVPLRFIAEELGLTVTWNGEYQRVVIVGEVDTETVVIPPVEEATDVEEPTGETRGEENRPSDRNEPSDKKEEIVEEATDFVEDIALTTIEAPNASITFEIPASFFEDDTESEESFAYRSLDAFDVQHTYNWDIVSRYESYADEAGTSGILFIVQELGPYEGEQYDLSGMNQEYPEAPVGPERPQVPEVDWQEMQYEMELVIMTQIFADLEIEMPEDAMELEKEALLEILGMESEEELTEQTAISAENADFSSVPGYDEYMAYQDEMAAYRDEMSAYWEEYSIYSEEVAAINAVKNYARRHFQESYSQTSEEEWIALFTTILNTDVEVRYEGVEIIDFDGKKIVHATIYAEDPDDEQGTYEYYEYRESDCIITIFGGSLFSGEASAEAADVLQNMMIQ